MIKNNFALQNTLLGHEKKSHKTGEKFLQIVSLIKDLNPEYNELSKLNSKKRNGQIRK